MSVAHAVKAGEVGGGFRTGDDVVRGYYGVRMGQADFHEFRAQVLQLADRVPYGFRDARMVAGSEVFRGNAHFQALYVLSQRGFKVRHGWSVEVESLGSCPEMAWSRMAASSTV